MPKKTAEEQQAAKHQQLEDPKQQQETGDKMSPVLKDPFIALNDILSPEGEPGKPEKASLLTEINSYESLTVEETKAKWAELATDADKLSGAATTSLSLLTPYLSKIQRLLSQRGADRQKVLREAGCPTWKAWSDQFAKRFQVSARTLRRHIKFLREGKPKAKPKKQQGALKLTLANQRKLVEAAVAGHDLVKAIDNDAETSVPLATFKQALPTEDQLLKFVEAASNETDHEGILAGLMAVLSTHFSDRSLQPKEARDAFIAAEKKLQGSKKLTLAA